MLWKIIRKSRGQVCTSFEFSENLIVFGVLWCLKQIIKVVKINLGAKQQNWYRSNKPDLAFLWSHIDLNTVLHVHGFGLLLPSLGGRFDRGPNRRDNRLHIKNAISMFIRYFTQTSTIHLHIRWPDSNISYFVCLWQYVYEAVIKDNMSNTSIFYFLTTC